MQRRLLVLIGAALLAGACLAVPLAEEAPSKDPAPAPAPVPAPSEPQPALVAAQPPPDVDQASAEGKDQVSGRGKMKNMGPLLAAGAMKIGMVGVLAFKALALLVGKALLVAKLAFLLAAIIGLKKLFSQDKHVTYEVVAHPHHSHSHVSSVEHHGGGGGGGGGGGIHHGGSDSYSSGWGRSLDVSPVPSGDPQQLAYRAHAKHQ